MIEIVDSEIDGMSIGLASGEGHGTMGVLHDGPGAVIAINSRFRRLGSDTSEESNKAHAFYLEQSTSLRLVGCSLEDQIDGRYV